MAIMWNENMPKCLHCECQKLVTFQSWRMYTGKHVVAFFGNSSTNEGFVIHKLIYHLFEVWSCFLWYRFRINEIQWIWRIVQNTSNQMNRNGCISPRFHWERMQTDDTFTGRLAGDVNVIICQHNPVHTLRTPSLMLINCSPSIVN